MEGQELLRAEHISKSFGATRALKDVGLTLCRGEVMALIGENGSGKSTLSAILTGALKKDEGAVTFKGSAFSPGTVLEARAGGIAALAQELGTINGMSVAENIFLGMESRFGNSLNIKKKLMMSEAKRILEEIGAGNIRPEVLVDTLSFETRKLVEVARAMYLKPEILIVDETTTALSQGGREIIYRLIRKMREEKKAVIFISHDLEEVQSVCDTAEILRDGAYITKLSRSEVTPDNMRRHMIGRELTDHYYREDAAASWEDEVTLKVEAVSWGFLRDISFELHRGEILGLGGLSECGMHELCKVIYGAIRPQSGKVTVKKSGRVIDSPQSAIRERMAYLPKDRDQESLFMATSIADNITVASLDSLKKGIYISPGKEKRLAEEFSGRLSIKMQEIGQEVKELSGGNKQKVAVAKWLANQSEILLMDCPTRGIDVGVKAAIYALMEELKREGKSILMISEEMAELIGMSDRILILKDGRLAGEFLREEVTEQMLIQKMI